MPAKADIIDVDGGNASVGKTPATFHVTPSHTIRHYIIRVRGYADGEIQLVPEVQHIEKTVTLDKAGTIVVHADAGVAAPALDAKATPMSIDAAIAQPPPAIDAAAPPPQIDAAVRATPNPCPDPDMPCLKAFPDAGTP